MGKYINPFTDIGFKMLFGQELSKILLIDFLNNLLKGERKITDITFLDKEFPAEFVEDRSLIYDILCETSNGDKIIVEMQNRGQSFFKKRSIYYVSEAISRQGVRGSQWKYDIHAVYFVAFLNFRQEDIGTEFRTDIALYDMKSKKQFSDDIRMIFLQLPYFNKKETECENDFERWIYVLKHMEALNKLPWAAKSPIFKKVSEISDISALSREERLKYDAAIKVYRDNICVYEDAVESGLKEGFQRGMKEGKIEGMKEGLKEGKIEGLKEGKIEGLKEGKIEGLKEGMAKGIAEGIAEGIIKTAKNMKSMGMDSSLIQKATGLSIEVINSL